MTILPISAFSDNYIWALINKDKTSFSCVDPGDAQPVFDFAKKNHLQLKSIFITHHHHDHIGGLKDLIEHNPSCLVFGPEDDRIPFITNPVHKDQLIKFEEYSFQILSNPGHTSSHISYFEPTNHWLFCGDTLFSAGCGRVFDGSIEQLYHSLQLFKSLPKDTKIFCAHEYTQQNLRFATTVEPNNIEIKDYLNYLKEHAINCSLPSTLEQELLINPFLRLEKKEIQSYAQKYGVEPENHQAIFALLREQKNKFS